MFRPTNCPREKSTFALYQRVYPVLESLEDRAPPSTMPASRLLGLPLEEPLAAFREWKTTAERDAAPPARELAPKEDDRPAALGPSQTLDLDKAADSAGPSLTQSAPPSLAPVVTDLSVSLSSGTGSMPLDLEHLPPRLGISGSSDHHLPPPVIHDFVAREGDNGVWYFDGQVDSAYVGSLTINFGSQPDNGLPSLQGQTVDVNANGSFEFSTRLGSCEQGLATAQTTDAEGQQSNVAEALVQQSGCGTHPGK